MKKKTATTTTFMNENRILHDNPHAYKHVDRRRDEDCDQITEQK